MKKNLSILLFSVIFCCLLFQIASAVSSTNFRVGAEQQLSASAGQYGADLGTPEDPRLIASYVIRIMLSFIGVLFVAYLVYGAFLWMTSAGQDEKVTKGKNIVRNAVIGTLIVLSAYSITLVVTRYMGVYTSPLGGTYGSYDNIETDSDNSQFHNPDPLAAPPNPYSAWGSEYNKNDCNGGVGCEGNTW